MLAFESVRNNFGGWWRLWSALTVLWMAFATFGLWPQSTLQGSEVYSGTELSELPSKLDQLRAKSTAKCFGPSIRATTQNKVGNPFDEFGDAAEVASGDGNAADPYAKFSDPVANEDASDQEPWKDFRAARASSGSTVPAPPPGYVLDKAPQPIPYATAKIVCITDDEAEAGILLAVMPPFALMLFGLTVRWIWRGFRSKRP